MEMKLITIKKSLQSLVPRLSQGAYHFCNPASRCETTEVKLLIFMLSLSLRTGRAINQYSAGRYIIIIAYRPLLSCM